MLVVKLIYGIVLICMHFFTSKYIRDVFACNDNYETIKVPNNNDIDKRKVFLIDMIFTCNICSSPE
jgi:hypothetical protein